MPSRTFGRAARACAKINIVPPSDPTPKLNILHRCRAPGEVYSNPAATLAAATASSSIATCSSLGWPRARARSAAVRPSLSVAVASAPASSSACPTRHSEGARLSHGQAVVHSGVAAHLAAPELPACRGFEQRSLPVVLASRLNVRAVREQFLDDRWVAAFGCTSKRCEAKPAGDVVQLRRDACV